MPLVFFQFGFKSLKQREGIGRGTGKARQYFAVMQFANLSRSPFDDDIS